MDCAVINMRLIPWHHDEEYGSSVSTRGPSEAEQATCTVSEKKKKHKIGL